MENVSRVFTFGFGHKHPTTGESLKNKFVEIIAPTSNHCRVVMLNHFGRQWAFEYKTREDAGVNEYNLTELPADEWPPTVVRFVVNTDDDIEQADGRLY